MSFALRRNLILLTTLIYLVFACSYVVLCKRDNRTINLLSIFQCGSSHSKIAVAAEIKSACTNALPILNKFLIRPRVLFNRIQSTNFFLFAVTLLSIFIFGPFSKRSILLIGPDHFSLYHFGLAFCYSWRI